jgi:HlyD family secretion protein
VRRLDSFLVGTTVVLLLFTTTRQDAIETAVAVSAASDQAREHFLYAEGELVTYPDAKVVVSAEANGKIVSFGVRENEAIHKGELIAVLDSSEQQAQLEEAEAQVAEANIDVRYLTSEMARTQTLEAANVVSKDSAQQTERELGMALASRDLVEASEIRLKVALAKTRVFAPIDGTVIATYETQGEMVAEGAPLLTIANLKRVRIQGEVPESDAPDVRVGMPALITTDGFSVASWKGVVEEVPATLVPRRLKPEDTAHPIQSRVLLVKIALGQATSLKLNQRVDITLFDAQSQKNW